MYLGPGRASVLARPQGVLRQLIPTRFGERVSTEAFYFHLGCVTHGLSCFWLWLSLILIYLTLVESESVSRKVKVIVSAKFGFFERRCFSGGRYISFSPFLSFDKSRLAVRQKEPSEPLLTWPQG